MKKLIIIIAALTLFGCSSSKFGRDMKILSLDAYTLFYKKKAEKLQLINAIFANPDSLERIIISSCFYSEKYFIEFNKRGGFGNKTDYHKVIKDFIKRNPKLELTKDKRINFFGDYGHEFVYFLDDNNIHLQFVFVFESNKWYFEGVYIRHLVGGHIDFPHSR